MDTEMELIENFHKKTEEQFLNEVRANNNEEIERMKQRIIGKTNRKIGIYGRGVHGIYNHQNISASWGNGEHLPKQIG